MGHSGKESERPVRMRKDVGKLVGRRGKCTGSIAESLVVKTVDRRAEGAHGSGSGKLQKE